MNLSLKTLRTVLFLLGQNLGLQVVARPRMKECGEGEGGRKDNVKTEMVF